MKLFRNQIEEVNEKVAFEEKILLYRSACENWFLIIRSFKDCIHVCFRIDFDCVCWVFQFKCILFIFMVNPNKKMYYHNVFPKQMIYITGK